MRETLASYWAVFMAYLVAGYDFVVDTLVDVSFFGDREAAELQAEALVADNRAQMGGRTNMVGLFIGLLIAGIVAIEVFIPVIIDAANNSNASGNTQTILDLLPLFAALLLLVALAAPLMRRV